MLASEHTGVMAQDWTAERTQYLGAIIQTMLRSYTDTAVNLTTGLLAFISRFALQVLALALTTHPAAVPWHKQPRITWAGSKAVQSQLRLQPCTSSSAQCSTLHAAAAAAAAEGMLARCWQHAYVHPASARHASRRCAAQPPQAPACCCPDMRGAAGGGEHGAELHVCVGPAQHCLRGSQLEDLPPGAFLLRAGPHPHRVWAAIRQGPASAGTPPLPLQNFSYCPKLPHVWRHRVLAATWLQPGWVYWLLVLP